MSRPCHPLSHHAAQLAVLLKLEAAVAVAAQNDGVVLLNGGEPPSSCRCSLPWTCAAQSCAWRCACCACGGAANSQVLPAPGTRLLLEEHRGVVIACVGLGGEMHEGACVGAFG